MPTADNRVYSKAQWEALLKETIERIEWLSTSKGVEYTHDKDLLANIRSNATSLGTGMELVWGVYAGKHWNAIRTYISDIVNGIQRERSEPIESRIDDMITYLLLFKAILSEGHTPAQKLKITTYNEVLANQKPL